MKRLAMVNRGIPSIQKGFVPRRKILFDLLTQRKMRLVIPGVNDGTFRDPAGVAKRYARLNPRTLKAERELEPRLEFQPAFSATEHKELEVFKNWVLLANAKAKGTRIFKRETRLIKRGGKMVPTKMALMDSPAKSCAFFSNTSKMACGSWSIPAGGVSMGGTCPSANTTKEVKQYDPKSYENSVKTIPKLATKLTRSSGTFPRKLPMASDAPQTEIAPDRNICEKCYAAKGNFGNPNIQLWQMARFAWAFDALERGVFVEEMTEALRAFLSLSVARADDGQDVNFFRIHDSGDFFSPEYLLGWAGVAVNLPHVKFWAPTRVWMLWPDTIMKAMEIAPNLVLRPSALQFSDPAPIVDGISTGGSTAHIAARADALEPSRLGIAEWDCPAYALDGKTCDGAMDASKVRTPEQAEYIAAARENFERLFGHEAPDNCRVCWSKPEATISYHAH